MVRPRALEAACPKCETVPGRVHSRYSRRPATVRDVTNWLCRRPDTLTEDEKPRLKAILDRRPELQAASDQVRSFAAMITEVTGQDLPQWMAAARDAGLPKGVLEVGGASAIDEFAEALLDVSDWWD